MPTKKFTRKELEGRNNQKDAVFVIDNVVYDVTKFLDDHPGGHEVLIERAGADATEGFDDIGHSNDAKELMKKYVIGEVVDADVIAKNKKNITWDDSAKSASSSALNTVILPVVLGIIATVIYKYVFDY